MVYLSAHLYISIDQSLQSLLNTEPWYVLMNMYDFHAKVDISKNNSGANKSVLTRSDRSKYGKKNSKQVSVIHLEVIFNYPGRTRLKRFRVLLVQ